MDRKALRKSMSPAGWSLLIYYILLNVCVVGVMMVQMILALIAALDADGLAAMERMEDVIMEASTGAGGYFLAAGLGLLFLLLWKKPKFWREEIWAKGKTMKPGSFLGLLCVFFSTQFIYQFVTIALEMILNAMGLTMLEGLEALSAGSDDLGMFLYMCVLAPVSEELLCRGLVQRILMRHGKKLAIIGSAFLFGLMHGNFIQTPYAFVAGLVLGYVTAEYSIAWAMVLHMVNNLMLGDMLPRLTAGLGDVGSALVIWGILILAAIGAFITVIVKRREISGWLQKNVLGSGSLGCFFSNAGVITFTVVMVLSMIATCFVLITPL